MNHGRLMSRFRVQHPVGAPGCRAIVGELVTGGVPEHVGVHWEWEPFGTPSESNCQMAPVEWR
jgi:hypothetical protein